MFIRFASLICLIISLNPAVFAQKNSAPDLELTWEVLKTNYQEKPQILAALTITNKGKQALPESGWKMYFNYGRKISDVEAGVQFEFLNGDLNRLMPKSDFKDLLPGKSFRIEYVASGKAINFRDAPTGFYLVWDTNPQKGFSIKDPLIKPLSQANFDGHISSEQIFEKNRFITSIPDHELIKVFPTPVSYQEKSGSFTIDAQTKIYADPAFFREATMLSRGLKNATGLNLPVISGSTNKFISVKKVEGIENEGYKISVTAASIVVYASTSAGAFYGIQSLLTMLPPQVSNQKSSRIPAVEVSDSPRFAYRAFMLDVARNFQSKNQVLKVLDLMALYKLNVLHFHLNDDEGWRLQIPSLPELTDIGAKRGHTVDGKNSLPASYGSGPDITNVMGSGFYSKDDFIEILKYATERHIRVIPEVETPGHARAAIKSMDARYERLLKAGNKKEAERFLLRDINDKSVYRSVQKWNDNVMNVALPSTYEFIETVIDDIRSMYKEAGAPLETIHLGGDEVPAGVWEKSPGAQNLQKSNPEIKSVDDLWYYYFSRVNQILKSRNLYLSGWEEVALRKTLLQGKPRYIPNPLFINENFHAYVWNNVWGWGSEDLAYRLANAGYKTILAPATNFYFDMAYHKDFNELGTYWATFNDIDAPFSFVPFDYYKTAKDSQGKPVNKSVFEGKERLTDFGKSNIVGLQCLIWTETVRSPEQLEYLLAPRLLAFAERAWSKEPSWAVETDSLKAQSLYNNAWNQFINVLGKRELPRLNSFGGGFGYRIPSPGVKIENGKVYANVQLPGFQIRYTTNGSEPTASSKPYRGPIAHKGLVKLKVFNSVNRSGKTASILNP